jgi:hypothetical protein
MTAQSRYALCGEKIMAKILASKKHRSIHISSIAMQNHLADESVQEDIDDEPAIWFGPILVTGLMMLITGMIVAYQIVRFLSH